MFLSLKRKATFCFPFKTEQWLTHSISLDDDGDGDHIHCHPISFLIIFVRLFHFSSLFNLFILIYIRWPKNRTWVNNEEEQGMSILERSKVLLFEVYLMRASPKTCFSAQWTFSAHHFSFFLLLCFFLFFSSSLPWKPPFPRNTSSFFFSWVETWSGIERETVFFLLFSSFLPHSIPTFLFQI